NRDPRRFPTATESGGRSAH
ncbi:histidinol-phosphatase, partial [Vibrio cholerae CP1035(8)]